MVLKKRSLHLAAGFDQMHTDAAQCENPVFVQLLGWAAHFHSPVT